jgi:CBS domain-containing protein
MLARELAATFEANRREDMMTVEEIMTRDVLTIGSEADVRDVARPVASGRVFPPGLRRTAGKGARKASARTVRDAMTAPAITVSPKCSLAQAARLMSDHGIDHLPVVRGDELVGIVTRTDLVRAFVRWHEEIRNEMVVDMLRSSTLWLETPDAIGSKSSAEPVASVANSRHEAMRCSSSGSSAASRVSSRSSPR